MGITEKYLTYYTVKDWKNWDGDWELIEGIPYALSPNLTSFSELLNRLAFELDDLEYYCKDLTYQINSVYYVSEDTVLLPNCVIYPKRFGKRVIQPYVIFEIVDNKSVKLKEHIKFSIYEREGIKYYVLIYPYEDRNKIKIYELKERKYFKAFETVYDVFSFKLSDYQFEVHFLKLFQK